MSSSYVLPEADLDDNGPLPVMRAARNPNSAVLLAITTGLFLIIKILARMRPDGRSASLRDCPAIRPGIATYFTWRMIPLCLRL